MDARWLLVAPEHRMNEQRHPTNPTKPKHAPPTNEHQTDSETAKQRNRKRPHALNTHIERTHRTHRPNVVERPTIEVRSPPTVVDHSLSIDHRSSNFGDLRSFVRSFIRCVALCWRSFVRPFVRPFVRSSVRSFVRSVSIVNEGHSLITDH